jgi:hypothetical protein
MQTHKFIITLRTFQGKRNAAQVLRALVLAGFSRVSVRSAKAWNGEHKPAKVSIRRLKDRTWTIYAAGSPLARNFPNLKQAREWLRNRHPALVNSVTVRR